MGSAPLSVTFTDQSSGSVDGHLWGYGDGTTGATSVLTHTHLYTLPGVYSVTLTVDGPGGSDALTRTGYITATWPPPVAGFSAAPLTGTVPLTVTFSERSDR